MRSSPLPYSLPLSPCSARYRRRRRASAGEREAFAPSGKLRVGVLMLSYFALEQDGQLTGWVDLGIERRSACRRLVRITIRRT